MPITLSDEQIAAVANAAGNRWNAVRDAMGIPKVEAPVIEQPPGHAHGTYSRTQDALSVDLRQQQKDFINRKPETTQ